MTFPECIIQFLSPSNAEVGWGNIKIYFHFLSFLHNELMGCLESFLIEDLLITCWSSTVNTMDANDLTMQGVRASAAMVWTWFACNITVSAPYIWVEYIRVCWMFAQFSWLHGGGWGCEVSCGGHHRPRGKTTTGSALDGAVFDIAQILAYLVHNMSRSQLYLGFGHFGWLPSCFGQ